MRRPTTGCARTFPPTFPPCPWAGLVAGLGADRVLGVDTGAVTDPAERVAALLSGLGATATATATGLRLRTDQVGEGYGALTAAAEAVMRTAGRTAGLLLDPVYSGKALAGLAASVADGGIRPGERTVFVHTGGLPGLFGHPLAGRLAGDLLHRAM
ncbi:pyridoxal-phosphate dependent enzyme [Blastococcus haudaquaticus]|uniref:pyridoxal-phosphate dependent enzyme n=1 Tax=Blastococcus haudaquaticus TaxID=1938745 RepID=UPI00190EA016|nr:pyridoxal-phosphate dependent enzyme [Blastococcus haudaquaticus]